MKHNKAYGQAGLGRLVLLSELSFLQTSLFVYQKGCVAFFFSPTPLPGDFLLVYSLCAQSGLIFNLCCLVCTQICAATNVFPPSGKDT